MRNLLYGVYQRSYVDCKLGPTLRMSRSIRSSMFESMELSNFFATRRADAAISAKCFVRRICGCLRFPTQKLVRQVVVYHLIEIRKIESNSLPNALVLRVGTLEEPDKAGILFGKLASILSAFS